MTSPMKDSGVDWIGKIPEGWTTEPLSTLITELSIKNIPLKTTKILSLVKDVGVMPYEEKGNAGNKAKENILDYKVAYPDTLVINSMNVLIGSVGLSKYTGCVSPVYYVFRETSKSDIRFINYIFNTREFQAELKKYAKGILEIRLRVSLKDIFRRRIATPSKDEQKRIASFLDKTCNEIDKLSTDIQSQIDKLAEYKKSIITHAVTKGLDPNAQMKDSGVDWIGKMPEEWNHVPLKYLIHKRISGSWGKDPRQNSNDMLCMRIADFEYCKIAFKNKPVDDFTVRNYTQSEIKLKTLHRDDILIEKSGGGEKTPVGRAVVYRLNHKALFANFMECLRFNKLLVDVEYIKYVLFTAYNAGETSLFITQTTGIQNINTTRFLSKTHSPLPPLNEQKQIADYLDDKCSDIDGVIEIKKKQLDKLAEYKKSIIYEYTTGKKRIKE